MNSISLIEDWKNNKKAVSKSIKKSAKKLKRKKAKPLDETAGEIHEDVFQSLDCLDCANCCSTIPPIVNKTDVRRIASHLGMKESAFQDEYLRQDDDGDTVMKITPCPFLESDHACSIYDVRPKACRAYPHTDRNQFSKNIDLHLININHCPAVYHILKRMVLMG